MDFSLSSEQALYRDGVRAVCAKFPESYWRQVDGEKRYPDEFVRAHPRLAGVLATLGSLFVLVSLGAAVLLR